MLSKLTISNVALISRLELDFEQGLNVLSGETGAGKSIIVDSLMLLLGGRYDKTLLKYGASEGFVEGFFTDIDSWLFEDVGLDVDECAVIRRRFTSEGRNDIKINGQSVTLTMLKRFAQRLVDIYGQNEHQSLTNPSRHLDILDYYARQDIDGALKELEKLTKEYGEAAKKLESIGDEEQRKRNIDILEYQIEEIDSAGIRPEEEEEILERRKILLSSERIKSALSQTATFINGDEGGSGAVDLLQNATRLLVHISTLSSSYGDIYSRLSSVVSEVVDICDTVESELSGIELDEGEFDELERRLEQIRSMRRKYGDYASMQKFRSKALEELVFLQNADEMYEKLTKAQLTTKREIYKISQIICQKRMQCAKMLESRVINELAELGMKDSRFEIVFQPFPSFEECEKSISKNGMDQLEFYLSANVGQPLLPLAKIISGGEMSRFMLALKVISASIDTVQTMIFDEIDAGISGHIGRVIAQKLATISRTRQVLCVTHLPQIAAMADSHYFISKQTLDGETITNVSRLSQSEMIGEISRLSGGQDISSNALQNAAEIKEWSNSFKNTLTPSK